MSSFVTGQIIEARCSRCRDVTGHVVMACLDGMPIKVECRACGSVHKYSAPGAAPRQKAETTVRVKAGHARTAAVDATVKAEKAIEALQKIADAQGLDWALLMVTDVLSENSVLLVSDCRANRDLPYARIAKQVYDMPGVMSRKKQLLPILLSVTSA